MHLKKKFISLLVIIVLMLVVVFSLKYWFQKTAIKIEQQPGAVSGKVKKTETYETKSAESRGKQPLDSISDKNKIYEQKFPGTGEKPPGAK
ncbi:MAG: hypothetical protein JSS53_06365 [Proteobacteria bacterium]|nr:hypothetical protein [Pseudomonadota bacterium]